MSEATPTHPAGPPGGGPHPGGTGPDPSRADDPPGWGPGATGLGILGTFVGLALLVLTVASVLQGLPTTIVNVVAQVALAIGLGAAAFVCAGFAQGRRPTPAQLGLQRPSGDVFAWMLIAAFGYIVCSIAIFYLLSPEQRDITRDLGSRDSELGLVVAGVIVIVGASLSEELFFRGFVFAGLRRGMPFLAAAVVSGLLWGLLHLGAGDVDVVIQLGVFGAFLALVYEKTGSIWPCIGLHALNNAFAYFSYVNVSP